MDGERLVETFVELADTLVDDFDVIDFLHMLADRCVELLDVDAAGLLLVDHQGRLQLIATSNEQARLLELFQLQNDEGPCLDAFAAGERVSHPDLASAGERWPRFTAAATEAGFGAVDAVPMRLRSDVIGALNLFRNGSGELGATELRTATALVDIATIGLLQQRSIHHHQVLTEQLQVALTSRVIIEQAKGLVAERLQVDMDAAFAALRGYARGHNLKLNRVAHEVIEGTISTSELLSAPTTTKPLRR
jgi:ANTAR domain/GAF domain